MDELSDMLTFLSIESRLDLKTVALRYILGLTGSEDGKSLLIHQPVLLKCLIDLSHDTTTAVAKDACLAIVNLSADETGARTMLSEECCGRIEQQDSTGNVVVMALRMVLDPECSMSDAACMMLSNLCRPSGCVERVTTLLEESGVSLEQLVTAFCRIGYNKKGAGMHYLGPFLSNLSQSATIRRCLMDRQRCIIQRLLPFTEYAASIIRRGGIIGMLRNCCFDIESHEWLLGSDVDLLPQLLLPLAGPEEFPEDEMDKLPPDLQYLPEDKAREPDPDIRRMLLEALMQLCATRAAREFMREKNAYVILRELHKWETDRPALLACENVVDVLIRTENEIGEDNLRSIEVPGDLHEKFMKMDSDFIND